MKLTRWTPFFDIEPFGDEMEKFFKSVSPKKGFFAPTMDVYEKGKDVIVEMSLPGFDAEKVDISIDENNVLTVKGTANKKTEVDEENYYRKEISYGSFYRSAQLGAKVKGDKAKAVYEDGILKISVPKADEKKTKPIKIKVKKKKK